MNNTTKTMERKMNTSRLKERYESPTVEKCQVMLEQMMAGSKKYQI